VRDCTATIAVAAEHGMNVLIHHRHIAAAHRRGQRDQFAETKTASDAPSLQATGHRGRHQPANAVLAGASSLNR
jgi:hypothetical protein